MHHFPISYFRITEIKRFFSELDEMIVFVKQQTNYCHPFLVLEKKMLQLPTYVHKKHTNSLRLKQEVHMTQLLFFDLIIGSVLIRPI